MESNLKKFVDKIFSINPVFSNMFGSGLPGMSGSSATVTGSDSTASNVVNGLRQSTARLAEKINANAPHDELTDLAKNIEGGLLNLRVLGQIDEQSCEGLVADLHALVKG